MARLLRLEDEEAMCLDTELSSGDRTVRVQVNVTFSDQHGRRYHATREIKMRLYPETDVDIQVGR